VAITTRPGLPREAGILPRLGVSACLLGQEVRYDGGHKREPWLVRVLGKRATFLPVCPEVEAGLGVPRPPLRLERRGHGVRLVEPRSGTDLTARMREFAARRVEALAGLDLDGFVLKSRSPSCGLARVKVHGRRGAPRRDGRGVFAEALVCRLPGLPVVDEEGLRDRAVREEFLGRVFAHRRAQDASSGRRKPCRTAGS